MRHASKSAQQSRTEITDKPTTCPSERLECVAEVTRGMANPGRTAPAADIFGLKCREAELDALVLQRWRHLFYPHDDESARRSAPSLTDVGSVLEGVCRQAISLRTVPPRRLE